MRTKFFYSFMIMLILSSCVKYIEMGSELESEEPMEVFAAVTENRPASRTSLSSYTNNDGCYPLLWSKGDAISISDGNTTAMYKTNDSNSQTAEFVCSEGNISNDATQYTAFYPSTITESNMVLPASQNYVANNVANFPMYAESSNKALSFKNLCGIIRFSLKAEESGQVCISPISLSADMGMSGKFTAGNDNSVVVSGRDAVVLNCTEARLLYTTSSTDFNIIVPKGEYNPLRVKISDSNGKEINLVSEGTISVRRSEITRITLTLAKSTFETALETIPITDANVDFTER